MIDASRAQARDPVRRLGVLGDVHGEDARLAAALDWFSGQRLDAVICTGDVADGPGCINRCCELLRAANVLTVRGNHDRWLLGDRVRHVPDAHRAGEVDGDNLAFLTGLPRTRDLDTVGGRLLLCHGIGADDMAKVWPGTRGADSVRSCPGLDALLSAGRYRFIVNGHLHFRVLIDFEHLLLLNAGTLKGARAGVSIIDFEAGSITAFELESGAAPRGGSVHSLHPGADRRVWSATREFDGRWEPVLL